MELGAFRGKTGSTGVGDGVKLVGVIRAVQVTGGSWPAGGGKGEDNMLI